MIAIDFGIGISIGGVVGFIIREIIGDRMARDRALETIRITEFNKGAAAFRVAFVDEEYRLRHSDMSTWDKSFHVMRERGSDVLIAHEKAKILFEPFIDKADLPGFNAAWETYAHWPSHYIKENPEDSKNPDHLGHLKHLLVYAKFKI